MGPLIPIVAIGAGVYAIKRWFDAKSAAPVGTAPADAGYADPGMPPADPGAPADQGGGGGGGGGGPNPTQGSGGPYDPGYPMNTDPTYTTPPAAGTATLKQQADAINKIMQPRLMTGANAATSTLPSKLGTVASRAGSLFTAAPQAPAPKTPYASIAKAVPSAVTPSAQTFSNISKAVLPLAPAPLPNRPPTSIPFGKFNK